MSVAHHELPAREAAEAAFRRDHYGYAQTAVLDELRRTDFSRLDRGGHVCLDYTGGGLFASSQLREHVQVLQQRVRQPSLGQPDPRCEHRAGRARPRICARVL